MFSLRFWRSIRVVLRVVLWYWRDDSIYWCCIFNSICLFETSLDHTSCFTVGTAACIMHSILEFCELRFIGSFYKWLCVNNFILYELHSCTAFFWVISMSSCFRSIFISFVTLHSAIETSNRAIFFWMSILLQRYGLVMHRCNLYKSWLMLAEVFLTLLLRLLILALHMHQELERSALKLWTRIYEEPQVSSCNVNQLEKL